jgi:inhibitor of cysteine peptidase
MIQITIDKVERSFFMMQPRTSFSWFQLTVSLFLFWLLAACTPVIRQPDAHSAAGEDTMAVANVRQLLIQQLHANTDDVAVVAVIQEEWSDSCLGAGRANESCALAQTPGYAITFAVNGDEYRYHTNTDGSDFRLVTAPPPAIGERVLTWTGTDASGCQTVEAGTAGVAYGPCFGTLLGAPYSFDTRQPDLREFTDTYQSFTVETPAGTVDFVGAGDQVATPAEQRMIAEWARLVALEAQGGRSGASWGLVFAWHREGGIAGFCDDVTVYVSGDAYVTSCKGDQPQALGRVRLSSNQLTLIYGWMDTLQPLEVEQRDPATADAMTTRIVFSGAGDAAANESIQREISDLALTLIYQATSDAAPVVQPEPLPMPAASAIITTATLPITDTGEAIIERVDVRILETNPVQIEAVIRGQLPDSCSFIQDASVGVEGNIFTVRLTTARQLDQRCIQILTPFEQIVRLGSPEPAAGAYEVYVGQVVESFTLGE